MEQVLIRKASQAQLNELAVLYKSARDYMHARGNTQQWNHFPRTEHLEEELAKDRLYVLQDAETGKLAGAFVLQQEREPTYKGLSLKEPYLTLHKVISSPVYKGSGKRIFEFALSFNKPLYIDTHPDNQAMLRLIHSFQGKEIGVITLEDGTPRLVFSLRS